MLNCSYNGAEGVLGYDHVCVSVCEDRDRLAHLPCALGTLLLQGTGPLQLGGGIIGDNLDIISPGLKMEVSLTCLKRWAPVGVCPHPSDRFFWSLGETKLKSFLVQVSLPLL